MNESVAKKTQETLGKVIKKPPLTEKLLSKPPFRYLHDVFSEVIRTTGFMKGLYGEAEMKADNVKLSSDEAVRRVLAGDKLDQKGKPSTSRSQDKENREGRERHQDREERKGIKESSGSREQKDPDQPKDQESKRDDKDRRRDAERSDKGRERDRTKDRDKDKDKSRDREKDKTREKEREKEKDRNRDKERERDKERDKKRERESHKDRERDKERDRERAKRREREKDKERHRETDEKLKDRGDRKIKAAEEISKPKPHPEVVSKTHEAEADEAESPSRIPRPSSAKGQRRWPKTGGQDETESEGEGEAPSAEKPVPIENGDTTNSVPPQTTHRLLPRPSSARPAAPRVKRQESYADVTPAERLGSGKTPATVILDGKKLSEDEDDEDGQFVVEEAAAPPPDIPEIERNSLELQEDDKHGGLVKKILETKKVYESSPSTKSKEQDRSLVSEVSRKKERELVAKEIERLRSSIQTVCRSALPLGKIMDYIQEDMDSMQNELQTWRKENKENAQALLQEQRITDSVVEPLKAELAELEQLIKDQQDKICAVKSSILKNEEKIQKMVSSISFSSQT
ncbi:TRAF3-interacting protein 1 isoform X2 [Sinocyclocheilus rhinocerous]|uniref:TRAF3-interacting protein 1-like n=1 Tax=Sinocyclocheilus rhinocerous TaxID=307959 RepID=A0A673LSF2_9TELE|nr:PREDICTED: TRAF3-interacting protein 1-like isoform X2 [Sinocyclocheilus rhinocerous]